MFRNDRERHDHSLNTLNVLYEYDDFMGSINNLVDLGCGNGFDLQWWATRTTREDNPKPLNINCVGVDIIDTPGIIRDYRNIVYQKINFEDNIKPPKGQKFDVLWSHDAFQYVINPYDTLSKWWHIANQFAALVLVFPSTINQAGRFIEIEQPEGVWHHHTIPSLMHLLAVTGWDCSAGYFLKKSNDPWIHAMVYRSEHEPMDRKTTTWFDLAEKNLLPDSAVKSIQSNGYVKQRDLILPWIDQNLTWYGKQ